MYSNDISPRLPRSLTKSALAEIIRCLWDVLGGQKGGMIWGSAPNHHSGAREEQQRAAGRRPIMPSRLAAGIGDGHESTYDTVLAHSACDWRHGGSCLRCERKTGEQRTARK